MAEFRGAGGDGVTVAGAAAYGAAAYGTAAYGAAVYGPAGDGVAGDGAGELNIGLAVDLRLSSGRDPVAELDVYGETLAAARTAGWDSVFVIGEEPPPALLRRLAALADGMRIAHAPCSGCVGARQGSDAPCLLPPSAGGGGRAVIRPADALFPPGRGTDTGRGAGAGSGPESRSGAEFRSIPETGCPGGGRPSLWLTADSAETVRAAAATGGALLVCADATLPVARARLEAFRAARSLLVLPPPDDVPLVREVVCRPGSPADDPPEPLLWVGSGGEDGNGVADSGAAGGNAPGAGSGAGPPDGGVQECLRDLREAVRQTRATELILRLQTPVDLMPASIRLLSSEVLPHLHSSSP